MADYMKSITALKDAEARAKERFENRTEISNLITLIHDTLENVETKIECLTSKEESLRNDIRNIGTKVLNEKLAVVHEDAQDLFEQLDILCQIICPMSGLLEQYQKQLKRNIPE